MNKLLPVLYLIIPCFNEESVLPITLPMFIEKLNTLKAGEVISSKSRILLIDDGSKDKTYNIISEFAAKDETILGVSLSRNHGHQNALLAGLNEAFNISDITITLDCDGQDDINAIDKMIAEYKSGSEIVYGVRRSRDSDTSAKRATARAFYKFMKFSGVETVYDHADYRLLSNRALGEVLKFKEANLYLRGIIPLIGFKSSLVEYDRTERKAGKTHYPLKKMIGLALNGITSFSVRPIQFIAALGFFITLVSLAGIIWSVVQYFAKETVSGWASLTSIICFFGGVQLLSIGIIGEYIGKIYVETKARPRFIVKEKTYKDE